MKVEEKKTDDEQITCAKLIKKKMKGKEIYFINFCP